jgi:hypothetical protein
MGTGSKRSKNMGIMGTWEHDCTGDGRYTRYSTTRQLWAGDWPREGVPWPGVGTVERAGSEV